MANSSTLQYQRVITGYHGCDRETVQKVLNHEEHLEPSQNKFDWLGTGVYFWEYGPRRALQFAREQKKRDKVEEPAVLGAYINLGRCFDLADVEHTSQLRTAYRDFEELLEDTGAEMPANKPANDGDHDLLLRFRDCALINWYMAELDKEVAHDYDYQTVRGVFLEGNEAFPGSQIREKSHIQVAVRDRKCILGYFLPTMFFDEGGDNGDEN